MSNYNELLDNFQMDVPVNCPECDWDEELESDVIYDEEGRVRTILRCQNPNCDFEIDVTKEFLETERLNTDYDDEESVQDLEELEGILGEVKK